MVLLTAVIRCGRWPVLPQHLVSLPQVRSEKAGSAVAEIIHEINNMREGKITEEELATAKALYNGAFALNGKPGRSARLCRQHPDQ